RRRYDYPDHPVSVDADRELPLQRNHEHHIRKQWGYHERGQERACDLQQRSKDYQQDELDGYDRYLVVHELLGVAVAYDQSSGEAAYYAERYPQRYDREVER